MEITLSITDGPALPANVLQAFGDRARESGLTPNALLLKLIEREARRKTKSLPRRMSALTTKRRKLRTLP